MNQLNNVLICVLLLFFFNFENYCDKRMSFNNILIAVSIQVNRKCSCTVSRKGSVVCRLLSPDKIWYVCAGAEILSALFSYCAMVKSTLIIVPKNTFIPFSFHFKRKR